jgi:hypothetical protein
MDLLLYFKTAMGEANILRTARVHGHDSFMFLEGYFPRAKELRTDTCSAREFSQAIQAELASEQIPLRRNFS